MRTHRTPTGLLTRAPVRVTRLVAATLRLLGVRDRALRWRLARVRARRRAAETRGDDSLSRPAMYELERKLDEILDREGGFFVEAGAHDGFTQSNTYWLERFRGWRGVLVEPMPESAREARLSRPDAAVFECALAPDEQTATMPMQFGDLMSMVEGAKESSWPSGGTVFGWRDPYELEVPARTLSSILDEVAAPEVDLLSLDVEGFEGPALQGLDLERHAPRYVLVELHDAQADRPAVDAVLSARYAEHGWLSPIDLLYVRRDIAASEAAGVCSQASSNAAGSSPRVTMLWFLPSRLAL